MTKALDTGSFILNVNADGSLAKNRFQAVFDSVVATFENAFRASELEQRVAESNITRCILTVGVIAESDAGDFSAVNADLRLAHDGLEGVYRVVVSCESWESWDDEKRFLLATNSLNSLLSQMSKAACVRSVPVSASPSKAFWNWVSISLSYSDSDQKLDALRQQLLAEPASKLLKLGDDVIAALQQISGTTTRAAAESVMGGLSDDRFAELRGYIVLCGANAFKDFKDSGRLPELPEEAEWTAVGEDFRFLIPNLLGRDYWETF